MIIGAMPTGSNLDLDASEAAWPQVVLGVAYLDENRPGWADKIDPETLDLTSTARCVVCQVVGLYYLDSLRELGLYSDDCEYVRRDRRIGFDIPLGLPTPESEKAWWRSADRLWKAAAAARVAK